MKNEVEVMAFQISAGHHFLHSKIAIRGYLRLFYSTSLTEKRKDGAPVAFSRSDGKVAAQGRLAGRQRMFLMP